MAIPNFEFECDVKPIVLVSPYRGFSVMAYNRGVIFRSRRPWSGIEFNRDVKPIAPALSEVSRRSVHYT